MFLLIYLHLVNQFKPKFLNSSKLNFQIYLSGEFSLILVRLQINRPYNLSHCSLAM